MILSQFACVSGCVQCFTLAQKCRIGISEFWPKLTFLLKHQINFALVVITKFSDHLQIHSFYSFRQFHGDIASDHKVTPI